MEKWPPYKGPKSKFHFRQSGRFRSSEKPLHRQKFTFCNKMTSPHKNKQKHIIWPKQVYLARLEKFVPFPPPRHRPRKSTQVTTSMEDLALYNQGYKALSLLITILASVVIFRLLTRDALGLRSTHTHTHLEIQAHTRLIYEK